MTQTDDLLRTSSDRAPNDIDRLMAQLKRIADALEQRNRIDEAMANFAQVLQRGAAPVEDVEVAPDGMPRKQR
jgi:ABC-type transporter Mla subunit MlaD